MRIILDTDKKTITVPWNYSDKIAAMNEMIAEITDDTKAQKTLVVILMKLGNYAAVGREMWRSVSTVSKYVQMKGVSQNVRIAVNNLIQIT